jgi:branched-subunit amino acid transport protein
MDLLLLIIGMGVITFGIRLSFILLFGNRAVPPLVARALRFVPPAVLSAIIVPQMVIVNNAFTPINPRLFAGLIAMIAAWRTKNVTITILAGLLALAILQSLFP